MLFLFFALISSSVHNFTQLIDHAEKPLTFKTFSQSYFEENQFFDENDGIIILKIGAETHVLEPSGVNDWMRDVAEVFHAKVLTLQHRFFGVSQPFDNTNVESLKFLTVEQAIEDYAYFHDHYNESLRHHPWLIVGGSYPGLLSAFTRKLHPNRFFAAISSAGVVFPTENYTDFDSQNVISLGQECASLSRTIRKKLNELLETEGDYIKKLLGITGEISKGDFEDLVTTVINYGAQYSDITSYCSYIVDANRLNKDLVEAFVSYYREYYVPKNGGFQSSKNFMIRLGDEAADNASDSRCWFWMTCNQLGYWISYSGRSGLRSKNMSPDFYDAQCKETFNMDFHRDIPAFNKKYDILHNVSHVAFITGSQDPWTWACVTEDMRPDGDNYVHTIIGQEVGHHKEFDAPTETDPPDLKRTRQHIIENIARWLKEEREKKGQI